MREHRIKYLRLSWFLPQLATARADGTKLKLTQQLTKVDLTILGDSGLSLLNTQQRHYLLESIDDWHRSYALITSQTPQCEWHQAIWDASLADTILDQILHNAHSLYLKVGSYRKELSKLNNCKECCTSISEESVYFAPTFSIDHSCVIKLHRIVWSRLVRLFDPNHRITLLRHWSQFEKWLFYYNWHRDKRHSHCCSKKNDDWYFHVLYFLYK